MSKKKKKNFKLGCELAEDLLYAVAGGGNFIKRQKKQPAIPQGPIVKGWTYNQLLLLEEFLRDTYPEMSEAELVEEFEKYINGYDTYAQFCEGIWNAMRGFKY